MPERPLFEIGRSLYSEQPVRVVTFLFLSLLSVVAEGFGLLFLLPLMSSVGIVADYGDQSVLVEVFRNLFAAVSLEPSLESILLLYILVSALYVLVNYCRMLLGAEIQLRFVEALQKEFSRKLLAVRWRYFAKTQSSDFLHVHTSEIGQIGSLNQALLEFVVGVVIASAYLCFALVLSPLLTIATVISSFLLYRLLRVWIGSSALLGAEYSEREAKFYKQIGNMLAGMKGIRSHAQEKTAFDLFSDRVTEMAGSARRLARAIARVQGVSQIAAALLLSVFVVLAVKVFGLPGATLVMVVLVFVRLFNKLSAIQSEYQQMLEYLPVYRRVMNFLTEMREEEEKVERQFVETVLRKEIRLENVSFHYSEDERKILHNVSMSVPAGSCAALIGPSGIGKTTVLDLIVGLLRPTEGRVWVDDIILDSNSLYAWRRQVGYVWQEAPLFHETFRENLRWLRSDISDAELNEALNLTELERVVSDGISGVESRIGERGMLLSGGERQRLAIARALAGDPKLLILDEATSAIDQRTERKVLERLRARCPEITLLIVTHRASLLRDLFDVVVDLEESSPGSTSAERGFSAQ